MDWLCNRILSAEEEEERKKGRLMPFNRPTRTLNKMRANLKATLPWARAQLRRYERVLLDSSPCGKNGFKDLEIHGGVLRFVFMFFYC